MGTPNTKYFALTPELRSRSGSYGSNEDNYSTIEGLIRQSTNNPIKKP